MEQEIKSLAPHVKFIFFIVQRKREDKTLKQALSSQTCVIKCGWIEINSYLTIHLFL